MASTYKAFPTRVSRSKGTEFNFTDKNRYLLEEHLLELPQARPELGASLRVPQDLLGPDEFELFPSSVRPQKLCAILGGVGARSFLHRWPEYCNIIVGAEIMRKALVSLSSFTFSSFRMFTVST